MQKTVQLSITQQIVLTLAVLLFFSLAVTFAGYMATGQTREKMTGFASDGAVASGVITKKYINTVGPGKTMVHWLDLTYTTADGASRAESVNVANTIHDRYIVGSPVQVTYVKSKPEYFYIPGTQPTERDVGISNVMFKYGAIASAVFLVGLLGFLFVGKGAARRQVNLRPRSN